MIRPSSGSYAYHGRVLVVDASLGRAESEPLDESARRRFLGGSGLGTYLMLGHGAAARDPFAESAPLAFVFSPLVGSPLTTSAKFAVVARSPLTMRLNDSLSSSTFALAGKRTGFDAIVVKGRARRWSILRIDGSEVSLESAEDYLGLDCGETERRLKERYPGYSAAVIGPAGERCVRFASISHDGRHAGRGGSGAVLGSKRIKAIVVRGSRRCEWADPPKVVEIARRLSAESMGPATAKYRELGTASNLLTFNRLRVLPTRNFQEGSFEEVENLAPETLVGERARVRASCAACTIGCEHLYGFERDGQSGQVRLEYESLFALGSLCGIGDPDAVLAAADRCDALGLDTISAGGTIAFAMECAEAGWIEAPWLRFGSGDSVLRALELMVSGEGIGKWLAEGSRRMAEQLGPDASAVAPHVKGLELPGYDPRGLTTMALGLAVNTRGADHNRSGAYEVDFQPGVRRHSPEPSRAPLAVVTEDRSALMDSMIICKFLRGVFRDLYAESAKILQALTGWDVTAAELQMTAKRIVSARKLFNIRAGWTPHEDTLPERLLENSGEKTPSGALDSDSLQQMVQAYNRARGWSDEGWLSPEHLDGLDLGTF